ncbi:lysozyme g-like [Thunnus maccoyii]|uniref:lysozyme g-like n=1 Tax=Thunnus maccoyii TaxID=8240 RepID=UPI001C4BC800|nr:lysozyme g-like [Thunnus maccoyii]
MKILGKINRNDLVQHLQNSSSGPKENRDIKNMDTKGTSEKTMSNDRYTEYGDITKVDTTGASEETMRANQLHGTDLTGVEASEMMADRDQEEVSKYKDNIISVGEKLKVHPALIAAIISKQSQAGTQLRPDGFGKGDPNCFGLMQLNKDYHAVKDDPFGKDHLEQGVRVVVGLIKTMRMRKRNWSKEQQLKGALTCYMTGVFPEKYEDIDSDFANDVVARAQWFACEGF